jgi:colanic acid/amylovoran biosynthesis protein
MIYLLKIKKKMGDNMKKNKVIVNGYFRQNLGDDLFLKILLDRYPNTMFDIYENKKYKEIFNNSNLRVYDKSSVKGIIFRIFRKLNLLNLYCKLQGYKAQVLIGGSIFMENKNIPLKSLEMGFNHDVPYYILGSNFGPYETNEFLELYKNKIFKNAKDVCFRENYSYELFKELPNIRMAPDIVFGLDISKYKSHNDKNEYKEENKVVISVIKCEKDEKLICNQKEYNDKIIKLIEYFQKLNYKIVLMSFSKEQGDEEAIQEIMDSILEKDNKENAINKESNSVKNKDASKPKSDIEKYFYRGNIDEALNQIATSKIVVGTRFHANILGFVLEKTVIPIAYSNKTINVLDDLGFKGKFFDLRKMEDFNVNNLNSLDLEYKLDVNGAIKTSEEHFKELDKILK